MALKKQRICPALTDTFRISRFAHTLDEYQVLRRNAATAKQSACETIFPGDLGKPNRGTG
jgi:hypothetical protein